MNATEANQLMLERVRAAWSEVLGDSLRPGFHGLAAVEITISNGTIQIIRRRVERVDK